MARSTFDKVKLKVLLENHVERGTRKAVAFVVSDIRKRLNRSQPTRSTAGGIRVGLDPSRPGESPKKVIGELQNSVAGRVVRTQNAITGFVGSPLVKARRLELGFVGTVRISAHTRLGGKIGKREAGGKSGFRFVQKVKGHSQTVNQKARPFIRPGINQNIPRILSIISKG